MLFDEPGEKRDVIVPGIERRDVMQVTATGFAKDVAVLHGGFLERLEAIGGKAGTNDV